MQSFSSSEDNASELEEEKDKLEITSEKKYLSVREAANYIGYSVGYIYKLVAINAIPCYVPNGGRIIFNRVELDEWIKSKRQGKPENECLVIR